MRNKMAALIRHGSLASPLKSIARHLAAYTTSGQSRYDVARPSSSSSSSSNDESATIRGTRTLDSAQQSLATRGFLRSLPPYDPPDDASAKLDRIFEGQRISKADDTVISDPQQRFRLFVACEEEFKHSIPNSLLCHIETVGDLRWFYSTPVDTKTPLEVLRTMDLPKNLHIQYDYHRFHPDTDTMFGGKTAFPQSSTLVTGLKYRKKYQGHRQKDPYLEELIKRS